MVGGSGDAYCNNFSSEGLAEIPPSNSDSDTTNNPDKKLRNPSLGCKSKQMTKEQPP